MVSLMRPSIALRRNYLSSLSKSPSARMLFYSTKSPLSTTILRPAQVLGKCSPVFSRDTLFHTSVKREILKPLPQVVNGTMNDAAPIPHHSPTHGSYHWVFERLVAAALVPLTIAPFAAGSLNPVMDAMLCATLVIHSHIGFGALITDYLPEHRVPKTRAFCKWLLRLGTLTVAAGLYEFETNDVGLTEAIKRIWKA